MARVDVDWSLFRKVCLVGFLGVAAYSLYPWAMCSFGAMDAAQLGGVTESSGHGERRNASMDTDRADRAEDFLGGFFGSFGSCYARNPIGQPGNEWQWPALGILLGGVFLFRKLDRMQYSRRVAKISANQAAVNAMTKRKQKSRATGTQLSLDSGSIDAVPRADSGDRPAADPERWTTPSGNPAVRPRPSTSGGTHVAGRPRPATSGEAPALRLESGPSRAVPGRPNRQVANVPIDRAKPSGSQRFVGLKTGRIELDSSGDAPKRPSRPRPAAPEEKPKKSSPDAPDWEWD